MKILFALFIGLIWWFVSRQFGASSPSVNVILVGGFMAITGVILWGYDVLREENARLRASVEDMQSMMHAYRIALETALAKRNEP